ncbi:MAG TPA: hypothetical protein VMZ91_13055 [Candidatus Paceibacterota bacterium]|nr:hypothetical protein [Candidatus Paceibacterota bacterium]
MWLRCSKCKNLKKEIEFYSLNKGSRGYKYNCKQCEKQIRDKNKEYIKEYQKKWYQKNRRKKIEQSNKWKKENKKRKQETDKKYRESHKEYIAEWHKKYNEKNADKIREKKKKYYQKNRERILTRCSKYNIEKAKNDVNYKLKKNVSRSILSALKGKKRNRKTEELIGYPIIILKDALEKQFESWMNWENYGRANNKKRTWQIDHIIPISLYNFFDEKEIKKCWHFRNLRPLNAEENLKKQDKLDWSLIEELKLEVLLPDKIIIE